MPPIERAALSTSSGMPPASFMPASTVLNASSRSRAALK
jgi:hypothetical protein